MKQSNMLWDTRKELQFLLGLYKNRKNFKRPLTKMGIFTLIGWDTTPHSSGWWNRIGVFDKMIQLGFLEPVIDTSPQKYILKTKEFNNYMYNDPEICEIGETEWIVEKILG